MERACAGGFRREMWSELGGKPACSHSSHLRGRRCRPWDDRSRDRVEELGRALVPGPLVATHLAAGLIDGAGSGEKVVTLVDRADPTLIEFGAESDALLILDEGSVGMNDNTPIGEPATPLDPLTPVLSNNADLSVTTSIDASAEHLRREGAVLTAALSSGISSKLVDLAVTYANGDSSSTVRSVPSRPSSTCVRTCSFVPKSPVRQWTRPVF